MEKDEPSPEQGITIGSVYYLNEDDLVRKNSAASLKAKCRELGLTVSGNKAQLAKRIFDHMLGRGSSSATYSPVPPMSPDLVRLMKKCAGEIAGHKKSHISNLQSPPLIDMNDSGTVTNLTGNDITGSEDDLIASGYSKKRPLNLMPSANQSPAKKRRLEPLQLIPTRDPDNIFNPRDGLSVVAYENKLYIFGGKENVQLNSQIDVLDLTTFTWTVLTVTGTPPSIRFCHKAVIYNHHMYIFGGNNSKQVLNDIYYINLKPDQAHEWKTVEYKEGELSPKPRQNHTAVVIGDEMYVFGGYDSKHAFVGDWNNVANMRNEVFDDLWIFNFASQKWRQRQKGEELWPNARNEHATVTHNNCMYICGGQQMTWGQQFSPPFEDIWKYDPKIEKWQNINFTGMNPKELELLAPSAASYEDNFYLFCGPTGIYKFNFNNQTWHKAISKRLAEFIGLPATVIHNGTIYLIGCYNTNTPEQKGIMCVNVKDIMFGEENNEEDDFVPPWHAFNVPPNTT